MSTGLGGRPQAFPFKGSTYAAVERHADAVALVAITAVAAAFRFSSLGAQSYWLDEAVSADLIKLSLHQLLLSIRSIESTPPLYLVLASMWAKVFGTGEEGLRALSAVLGTATVPVSYLAARTLAGRRTAVLAALFVALAPIMVWYSQEARSYALYALLSAVSFLFFARLLARYRAVDLAAWSISSTAALTAHYFAGFLVLVEAIWLIRSVRHRRALLVAFVPVVAVQLALLPLVHWQQNNHGNWVGLMPADFRLKQFGTWFLTGHLRAAAPIAVAAVMVALGLFLLVRRAEGRQRMGGLTALGVGVATVALVAFESVAVRDYFLFRNVLNVWVPLAVALAAGFTAPRAGRLGVAAACVLCAVFAFANVATVERKSLQRDDWRTVSSMLVDARKPAAFVVYPLWGARPLIRYGKSEVECLGCIPSRRTTVGGVAAGPYDSRVPLRLRDIWFVGWHGPFESDYTGWPPPDAVRFRPPRGFERVIRRRFQNFVIEHFVSSRTQSVRAPLLLKGLRIPPGTHVADPSQTRARVLLRD